MSRTYKKSVTEKILIELLEFFAEERIRSPGTLGFVKYNVKLKGGGGPSKDVRIEIIFDTTNVALERHPHPLPGHLGEYSKEDLATDRHNFSKAHTPETRIYKEIMRILGFRD